MKSAFIVILSMLSNFLIAQQIGNDKHHSIYYTSIYKVWEDSKNFCEDEKILEVCNNQSRFYAVWQDKRQLIIDSIAAGGGDQSGIWQVAYPVPYSSYSVYKNYPLRGQLTYHDKSPQPFIYHEPLEEPVWIYLPGDTTIRDYPCKKAITHFNGRQWSVWYTQEIPINEGPWKLWGLPGLILRATEDQGIFSFTFTHMIVEENKKIKIRDLSKFKRTTCQNIIAHKIRNGNDPVQYLKEQGKYYGPGYGIDGKPIVYKPRKPALLEY